MPEATSTPATKEVVRYRQALRVGYEAVVSSGLLTNTHVLRIQQELELNDAGFRRLPGTVLKASNGRIVYTPPQDHDTIVALMTDLERFINEPDVFDADPLIRMALIHHQFESIHPFYDGNGRTGRIINVLYLVQQRLLDSPVLYLSRHIARTRADYYRLLQDVRERDAWEEWVLYMLTAVDETANESVAMIEAMKTLLLDYKHRIRAQHKFYSQDLINILFSHPYTKIEFIQQELKVSRLTATKYLDALARDGFVRKTKVGRTNYYINPPLYRILTGEAAEGYERLEQSEGATRMSNGPHAQLTPAERVDDVPRTLGALRRAVQEALQRHKLAGNPVAIWKDGSVEWVQPEDIPGPGDSVERP